MTLLALLLGLMAFLLGRGACLTCLTVLEICESTLYTVYGLEGVEDGVSKARRLTRVFLASPR